MCGGSFEGQKESTVEENRTPGRPTICRVTEWFNGNGLGYHYPTTVLDDGNKGNNR